MKKTTLSLLLLAQAASFAAFAQTEPAKFTLKVGGFADGAAIPDKFAYCAPDGNGQTKDGGNVSPEISWSAAPAATKSYAIVVVDPDVPASFESANKTGKTIPNDFPRQNYYHWVLTDIPPSITSLAEGKSSTKVVKEGKATGTTDYGMNGANDYGKGGGSAHGGYDGPCPPWNDERLHHYHFTVYALDTAALGLASPTGADAMAAINKHALDKAEWVGTFTNNPKLLSAK